MKKSLMMKRTVLLLFVTAFGVANAQNAQTALKPVGTFQVHSSHNDETTVVNGDSAPKAASGSLTGNLGWWYSMLCVNYHHVLRDGEYVNPHDSFGKRSMDMWTDILSGDMALTDTTYRWFVDDERLRTMTERADMLVYWHQRFLYALNKALYDFPDAQTEEPAAYAQIIGLRGYVYSRMAILLTPAVGYKDYGFGNDRNEPSFGYVYTEDNFNETVSGASSGWYAYYERAIKDLSDARALLEKLDYKRPNKTMLDHYVLSGLLAQTYLNMSVYLYGDEQRQCLENALDCARYVIESGAYSMLPSEELLTGGFNNVESANWLWGMDKKAFNGLNLKMNSFFGQVDIHTDSYAWAGDTKVIDANLRDMMPSWDKRRYWFNNGKDNSKYKDCPDGKFFSALNNGSVAEEDLDREYGSDDVYMRYESILLTAAEAKWRLGDYSEAAAYLTAITDQRFDPAVFLGDVEYDDFKAGLFDSGKLKEAIIYNWRVEMWGEGYGLETFRRWQEPHKRGGNHNYAKGIAVNPVDEYFQLFDKIAWENHTGRKAVLTIYTDDSQNPQMEIECMAGDKIDLVAAADDGNVFSGWSCPGRGYTSESPEITWEVMPDDVLYAHFVRATAVPETVIDRQGVFKIIKDGRIYIRRNDRTFDLTGRGHQDRTTRM